MRIERDQKSKERKERKQATRREQRSKKSGPLDTEEYDAILYETIKDVKQEIIHGAVNEIQQ